MRSSFICLVLIAPAFAQIGAPVMGYIPDGSKLRPVLGMPSAASVMPPVDSGRDLALTMVSPHEDYALATAADTGEVLIVRPAKSAGTLAGAHASPDAIAISPEGSAAAMFFAATHHIQIVQGLPDSPQIREVDVTFLNDAPAAMSVSDDGQWMAGAWTLGVHAFGPNGEVNRLPIDDPATAVAFFHTSHDLAVTTVHGIFTVSDVGGRSLASTIGMLSDSLAYAAVAKGNNKLIVASAAGNVTSLDLSNGNPVQADCGCTPKGLFPIGRNSFRLTGLNYGAFKLFDADTGDVLFAPITSQEGDQQ